MHRREFLRRTGAAGGLLRHEDELNVTRSVSDPFAGTAIDLPRSLPTMVIVASRLPTPSV